MIQSSKTHKPRKKHHKKKAKKHSKPVPNVEFVKINAFKAR